MGPAGGGQHNLFCPSHGLGHSNAQRLERLKIPFDSPMDHHLFGEVGQHQPPGAGRNGGFDRLGVGDGLPDHGEESIAGQHGGRDLLGWLLAVLCAGLHDAHRRLRSHPIDLSGQRLGNAQAGQLGDDEDLLPGLHFHAGIDHFAGSP